MCRQGRQTDDASMIKTSRKLYVAVVARLDFPTLSDTVAMGYRTPFSS